MVWQPFLTYLPIRHFHSFNSTITHHPYFCFVTIGSNILVHDVYLLSIGALTTCIPSETSCLAVSSHLVDIQSPWDNQLASLGISFKSTSFKSTSFKSISFIESIYSSTPTLLQCLHLYPFQTAFLGHSKLNTCAFLTITSFIAHTAVYQ